MGSKACGKWKSLLVASACGDLERDEELALERHLRTCPQCVRERNRLRRLFQAAQDMPTTTRPPQAFWDQLPGRIVERLRAEGNPARVFSPSRWALAAASVILLAGALFWVAQHSVYQDDTRPAVRTLEERLAQLEKDQLEEIFASLQDEPARLGIVPEWEPFLNEDDVQEEISSLLPGEWSDLSGAPASPFSWPSMPEVDVRNLSEAERAALIEELNSFMI